MDNGKFVSCVGRYMHDGVSIKSDPRWSDEQ